MMGDRLSQPQLVEEAFVCMNLQAHIATASNNVRINAVPYEKFKRFVQETHFLLPELCHRFHNFALSLKTPSRSAAHS